ncbi:MAG: hypothetical protein ABJH82_07895 [Polaribacter sp.]|uniref:hypothetical protein n=1 Tax=Polaribacter sp. TaxID=1920175 RepID=UPI003265F1A2
MIPTSIEILHVLENHEHSVCTSINEHHIHKQHLDCADLHKHLTFFSMDFTSNFDVIPTHFYATNFIDKTQFLKEVYHYKKHSRGPPVFV